MNEIIDKYLHARAVIRALVQLEDTISGWLRDSGMPPMSGDDPDDLPSAQDEIVWIAQQVIPRGTHNEDSIRAVMYNERKAIRNQEIGNRARMRHLIASMIPRVEQLIDDNGTSQFIEDDRIVAEMVWFAQQGKVVLKAEQDQ